MFVLALLLLMLLMLVQVACSKNAPLLHSPDGKHIVITSYALQGALGSDYANVTLRRNWIPFAETAYQGTGHWDFSHNKPGYPEVRWLDDSHLSIKYYDDEGDRAVCRDHIGTIRIDCHKLSP